jgi:phospholipase/carboxylesterase
MARALNFKSAGAAKGKATSLMVLIHGYGANGDDLLCLSDSLIPYLPYTAFISPDAPEACSSNGLGFQWFPIPRFDGSTESQARAGMLASSDDLNTFLDVLLAEYGLGPEALALFGFSQGAMMSLHISPRRNKSVAGVIACSGRLLIPELLQAEMRVKPPILLMHGDQDLVVPFTEMSKASDALMTADFDVYSHIMKGAGHSITPDGLGATLQFLKKIYRPRL